MDEFEKIHKKFYNNHMVDDKHCKCQICGCVLYKGMLGIHLKKVHTLNQEEYYLKITGINTIPKCKNHKCDNSRVFMKLNSGYSEYCCTDCYKKSDFNRKRLSKLSLERWEDYDNYIEVHRKHMKENVWNSKEKIEKIANTRSKSSKEMFKFKKEHNGLCKAEFEFYNKVKDKYKFSTQVRLSDNVGHITTVDFLLNNEIVVEIDGGSHTKTVERNRDNLINERLINLGYKIIRIPNSTVFSKHLNLLFDEAVLNISIDNPLLVLNLGDLKWT